MILLYILHLINIILIQSNSYEISRINSNDFLKSKTTFRSKYEELKETTETQRELCLDEYRQQEKSYQRRQPLSPFCTQYCAQTMDCQQNKEESACINPSWSSRTIKYVQKYERMCYIRITEVLRYDEAEQMCHRYGLQLAIIDNIRLLERLKQLNMFTTTCKGECPKARSYYIGLKRMLNNNNQSESKWIWSNNVTWIQNQTDCDNYAHTSYSNASLLCYVGIDGEKKVTVWNRDEPNNYENKEQCVEIIVSTDKTSSTEQIGKLNDIPCNKPTLGVICQMKDTKPINLTRFEYFATIVGLNKTKINETDLLNNFFNSFDGSIPISLDAMTAMTAALERLLTLPSFTIEQATNVFNLVDQLVNITGQIQVDHDSLKTITNKLLQFLDLFPTKIQIKDQGNVAFEYTNMNLSIIDVNLSKQTNEWFTVKSNQTNEDNLQTIIEINLRVLEKQLMKSTNHRIIETIFSNFNLFPQSNSTNIGIPISYQIANITAIKAEEDLIRYQIRISEVDQSYNYSCVYWSFDEQNGSWISDHTCRFDGYINNYAQCYCNHLTHFALLVLFDSKQSQKSLSKFEEFLLKFVTYIGIGWSIFGLLMTLITYALFRHSNRTHLHGSLIMLCTSILMVNCLYIPFSLLQTNLSDLKEKIFCNILGFFFHYFLLASFMWMLIMAIVQYMHFVRIFNSHISHFFLKTCVIGWLSPFIFPFLVILFGKNGGYTQEDRCWINHRILFYITFLFPIFFIIICNLILFGFILKSIYHRNPTLVTSQKNHSKLQMSAAVCCFVSIGCTWLFGIIVLIQPTFVHQFLFCLFNSFQGFFIFLFHVYLSKPKRELWRTFFLQRKLRKQSQSSSSKPTELLTISRSSGGNVITRPIKIRFNPIPSNTNGAVYS